MNDKELNEKVNLLKRRFPEYLQKVNKNVDKIFEVLRQSELSIDRCRIVGGLGKKTSVLGVGRKTSFFYPPDADLAVFYNGNYEKASLAQYVQQLLGKKLSLHESNIFKTRNDVFQFEYNGLDVDLVLAQNLATSSKGDGVDSQWKNAFELFKNDPNMSVATLGMYIGEAGLKVMKGLSPFVHDVALLCKCWNSEQKFDAYVYGRSFIMETLGVMAAVNEEDSGSKSIKNAYVSFLKNVSTLKSGRFIPSKTVYKSTDIPAHIRSQTPLLLDPTNPCNNLLKPESGSLPMEFFDKFEAFAKTALKSM